MRILQAVRRFRVMLAFLFLALWVPATGHCLWENVLTLESGACGEHANTAETGRDCCGTSCNAVENGFVKSNPQTAQDLSGVVLAATAMVLNPPEVEARSGPAISSAPPDLSPQWQFLLRTALPVRAPSLLS